MTDQLKQVRVPLSHMLINQLKQVTVPLSPVGQQFESKKAAVNFLRTWGVRNGFTLWSTGRQVICKNGDSNCPSRANKTKDGAQITKSNIPLDRKRLTDPRPAPCNVTFTFFNRKAESGTTITKAFLQHNMLPIPALMKNR